MDWAVALVFLKLGCVGFGGGYAILSLMFESIQPLSLITMERFQDLIAVSQITPGPVAINTATYVGYLSGGWLGAFLCSIALCIPGMTMMYLMVVFIRKGRKLGIVDSILGKVRVAGIVLLIVSGLFIAEGTLFDAETMSPDIIQMCIFADSLFVCFKFRPGPVKLILIMGAVSVASGLVVEMVL